MSESDWWYLDLSILVLYVGGVLFALVAGVPNPIRIAVAIPLLIFVPGYAALSMLYPDRGGVYKPFDEAQTGLHNPIPPDQGLTPIERFSLSVVVSLIIVPLVALTSTVTPWGITHGTILVGLAAVTIGSTLIAIVTRWRCDPERRFDPTRVGGIFLPTNNNRRRSIAFFNIALLISFLLLGGSVGYALVERPQAEGFTEFYVETDEVTGDVDTPYEATFESGQTNELTVNIINQEGTDVEYTSVVILQQVTYHNESVEVHESDELTLDSLTVGDGEHDQQTLSFTPSMSGNDLRLVVLLYDESPPDDPSMENAYRDLSLPIVVN